MPYLTTVGGRILTTVSGQRIYVGQRPNIYYPQSGGVDITTDKGVDITTQTGVQIEAALPTSNRDIQLFDFSVDLLAAILWQYNDAANLQSILQQKQDWFNENQEQFWIDFYNNIFNLETANEFGLAVWAIILGLPLFINAPPTPDDVPIFGFGSANGAVNFDNGILGEQNGTVYNLPLETKRTALKLRYFQITSSGTVPETNRMLDYVFGSKGKAFLEDYGDMTQGYIFLFPVTWDLAYIFNNLDILPRPAGVGSSWIDATLPYFGFGPANLGFDQAIMVS